jgi:hypothetical protein
MWNEVKKGYVDGGINSTFLLQLDKKEKYIPTEDKSLIYCNFECGPIFGKGHDLCILDQCNDNECFGNFPTTFNLVRGDKYQEGT